MATNLSEADRGLFDAIRRQDVDGAREAFAAGANPNACNDIGFSPLGWCWCACDKLDMAKLIIDQPGMDPNLPVDKSGGNAIHLTAQCGQLEITQLLLEAGANPNIPNHRGHLPIKLAISHCHPAVVSLLLDHGVDIHTRFPGGNTPAHCAAGFGYERILVILRERGADFSLPNDAGKTPDDIIRENKEYLARRRAELKPVPKLTP